MNSKNTGGRIVVVFRNDDPSGTSDPAHERKVAEIFDRYGVPQTLGVIPFCTADSFHDLSGDRIVPMHRNPDMVRFLREYAERSGSEIALHGYTHRTNRLSRPSKREYFEFRGIGFEEQSVLIGRGVEIVKQSLGVRPQTFIPPWNRLDANTLKACVKNGFQIVSAGPYTPVLEGLHSLGTDSDIFSFPNAFQEGVGSGNQVFIRICYHSRTIRTPEEFQALEKAVRLAGETSDCETLTLAEAVRRYPEGAKAANDAAKNGVRQEEQPGTVRARAKIYRRFFSFLPSARDLEDRLENAEVQYQRGRYEEASGLTPAIDRLCGKLRTAGLALISTASLLGGVAMGMLLSRADAWGRKWGFAGACAAILAAGLANWWYATSADTRREIRDAVLLAAAAAGAGYGSRYFLIHVLAEMTR